ncbi:TIGR01212 family radical SAM protein [Porphyromonas sp. COT-290 OH860]|uniref:TIGR01212 family radical SAM protein n=1 Tax=Porphyromonas sp. COT-290 OH860 TaxID=1515615 RepID=UPI00052DBE84|nr:TIGR01212 family radical SAM protein [Porphyromonas sp. COT-290 OH860]KGN86484.1 radical SAM protein [Porphyromonas sp. COT-290 OH860]
MNEWIDFGSYLRERFGGRCVQKITLSAGFTCPTRDGTHGRGGCTYCNVKSFSPAFAIRQKSVSEQLREGIAFFAHKYPDMEYIAYFQSYTNTYGEVEECIRKYEEALTYPGVVGLIIGTRPDCMPDELLSYLSDLAKRHFVIVEYGVESTLDRTLDRVQRGHSWATSVATIERTHRAGIIVGAHLILGLPGESREEQLAHADRLSALPITTLKIHQLQIIKGTIMAAEYLEDPSDYHLYTEEEYIELCLDFLERLRPDIVIERFVSQSPMELLLAPRWGWKNYQFTEKIRSGLRARQALANSSTKQ